MAWDPRRFRGPVLRGGASSPSWGGYVRLYVRAAIAAGRPFTIGPHTNDRLDAGNVLSAGASRDDAGRLWIDLSCDVTNLQIVSGASSSTGILTQADAATVQIDLLDPEGHPRSDEPGLLRGRSRGGNPSHARRARGGLRGGRGSGDVGDHYSLPVHGNGGSLGRGLDSASDEQTSRPRLRASRTESRRAVRAATNSACGHRHLRDRRHGGRYRVATVPRGDQRFQHKVGRNIYLD